MAILSYVTSSQFREIAETWITMNPSFYTSAMEGNLDFLRQHINQLDGELTPNHNTVLDVAAQFGHLDYVKEVLEACPSLLCRQNVKGETPLHTAAREGRAEMVKAMIGCAKILEEELESGLVGAVKEMLRAANVDGDTALHMAARNCHFEGASYLTVVESFTEGLKYWGLGEEEVEEMVRAKNQRMKEIAREAKVDIEQLEETMSIKEVSREKVEEIMRATKEVEEIMRATKVDRDTGMHTAARNRFVKENRDTYLEVVKLLSEEDAEFQHPPNTFQETPLYLAAERGIMGVAIVDTLVETYKNNQLTYSGPCGRTALHAAALKDSTGQSTKKLLEWKKDLINQADDYGWIPLHYAACNTNAKGVKELLAIDQSVVYITTANKDDQDTAATSNGNENGVRELLVMDESGAYITTTNKDGLDTALHIAAAHGHVNVMKELLSYSPDCWEMVNSKGQNVLHIAVDMNRDSVIYFILDQSWVGQLINQKDNEGNTPLHLLIASDCKVDGLWTHERADHHAFNGKNMTPADLVWSNLMEERMSTFAATYIVDDTFVDSGIGGGRNIAGNARANSANLERARTQEKEKRKMTRDAEKQREEEERKTREGQKQRERVQDIKNEKEELGTLMIVASLIATITFAAAFAIPGGYDGNQGRDQGMAVLARAAAFKSFLVTNTIAMVCSVTSVILCLTALGYAERVEGHDHLAIRTGSAFMLIFVSVFVVMIAFISAMFAVLAHSTAFAIFICVIACTSFIVYYFELRKFISFLCKLPDSL